MLSDKLLGLMLARNRMVQGRVLWTPKDLPGLQFWYDAQADTSVLRDESDRVFEWRDRSGKGRHLTATSESTRPGYVTNSFNTFPSIYVDGTNSKALIISPDVTNIGSVTVLHRWQATTGDNRHLLGSNTNFFGASAAAGTLFSNTGSSFYRNGQGDVNGLLVNMTTLPRLTSNSILVMNPTQNTAAFNGTGWQSGFPSRSFFGNYAEIVGTNNTITVANRMRLEGYLAHKWGMVGNLPQWHPYLLEPPYRKERVPFLHQIVWNQMQIMQPTFFTQEIAHAKAQSLVPTIPEIRVNQMTVQGMRTITYPIQETTLFKVQGIRRL